jgi:predicted transcriptional regulator
MVCWLHNLFFNIFVYEWFPCFQLMVGHIKELMLYVMKYKEPKNMKQKNVYKLDKDDGKAIQLFVHLGMPKNLAKTLLCISQFDECKCADVEQVTDMRQPEVSIAMQELHRRGWIKRELKKKGKGRPVHIYKTTTDLSEILNVFEQEKLKEVENVKNDISALKNIIQNR